MPIMHFSYTIRTNRAKGNRRNKSVVVRWKCRISRKALVPGRSRRGFRGVDDGSADLLRMGV